MTDTPNRTLYTPNCPLWQALKAADASWTSDLSIPEARAIKAMRNWLFPAGRPGDDSCCDVMQARLWDQLTTEADRAEAGE